MEDGRWKMEDGKWKMEGGKWKVGNGLQSPISNLQSPFSIFHSPLSILRDRRGSVAVQALLLLPIFVLVVFGGYETLQAMSVKQALHEGAYQAVRYLSLNPIITASSTPLEEVAWEFILQELTAEVGDEAEARRRLIIRVPIIPQHVPPWCGDRFRIEASYFWEFDVPFAEKFGITLHEEYDGRVICS